MIDDGTAAAAPSTPPDDAFALTDTEVGQWKDRIERALKKRRQYERWWEANVNKYAPLPAADPTRYAEEINTNRDYALVEQKKAQLFYQVPEVSLKPSPLFEGAEDFLRDHRDILNERLGPDYANIIQTVQAVLFDKLCPAGLAVTKMGYESATIPVPGEPDPLTGELGPPIDVPIYENIFWQRVSPKRFLVPENFHDSDFEQAPWLGVQFLMPRRQAARMFGVPIETFEHATRVDREQRFDYGIPDDASDDYVAGSEIWYKAALYRDDVIHPQQLYCLVLIDGLEDPVVKHQPSPYQLLGPDGRLTPDSLIGFPIHVLTTTSLADTPYQPSDCTVGRPLVNELNRFREQMIRQREITLLRWRYNSEILSESDIDKIITASQGGLVPFPGEGMTENAFSEMPQGQYPRENFTFNDYVDNDLARTFAIDAQQQGVGAAEVKTATEVQAVQSSSNVRLDAERQAVLRWFIAGVGKYSTLLQRYLTVDDAARIIGPQRAQRWASWIKSIPHSLAFTAQPDAALRLDIAQDRQQALQLYQMTANDPNVNRVELLKTLFRKHHIDPTKIIVEPPPKGPEPPNLSFRFSGDDLNPINAQFPIVMEIMRQTGLQVSPQAMAYAESKANMASLMQAAVDAGEGEPGQKTEHGGKVQEQEPLSKHQQDLTGGMQGLT